MKPFDYWVVGFDFGHCQRRTPTVETAVWHDPNPFKRVYAGVQCVSTHFAYQTVISIAGPNA